ncbi:MAG: hypothetical protein KJ732_04515 [Candidatus Margulisbacteria bacterium]|nr:hypothetical protein [Candidatus Margulisiibacteriota bacterium]
MKKIISLYLLMIVFSSAAFASYISLNTSLTTKVDKNDLMVLVTVINKGDESAHNVQAELRVGGEKYLAEKKLELGINQTYTAATTFKLKMQKPGLYPLVLVMHYTDANQYPFSALTCNVFSYQAGALPAEIIGKLQTAAFWQAGQTKLTLKNLSDSEIAAETSLVVPRELTVTTKAQKVRLAPKSNKTVTFGLENFSALDGSTYQVFAITEYEKDGFHQTNISPGMVKIVESNFFRDYRILIVVLVAILLVVFVLLQIKKK